MLRELNNEDRAELETLRRVRLKAFDGLRMPTSLPRAIVAFVGQNENGALRRLSRELMELAEPHGFKGHIVDLMHPEWPHHLRTLLDAGVLLAWGAAGIGARLTSENGNLWDQAQVPFISVLSDSPCWLPANHHIPSRYVANGYVFQDWLSMQQRLIRSSQVSALLPHGVVANPFHDAIPWSRRQHRMVFVKTGHAPELHRQRWLELPSRFRAVVEETSAAVLKQDVCDITAIYLRCLDDHDLYVEQRSDILFGLMQEIDVYVRDYRSTAMVRGLLDLSVDIVGRGWDHVKDLKGKARFHDGIDASALPKLYSDTQFLLNTMPNFSTRTHERVLDGFGAKCCVVTNENAEMRSRFTRLLNYFAVDTEAADLAERLSMIYHSTTQYDDHVQTAFDLVRSENAGELLMRGIIDLAMEVRAVNKSETFKSN